MIEAQIKVLLSPLCPDKVFIAVAPMGTSPPYIVYTPISESYSDSMCGQTVKESCYQVDVYSKRYTEAKKLADDAYQLLKKLQIYQVENTYSYESDTEYHRYTLEFFHL